MKEIFFRTYLSPTFNPNMNHKLLKLEETLVQPFHLTDKEARAYNDEVLCTRSHPQWSVACQDRGPGLCLYSTVLVKT